MRNKNKLKNIMSAIQPSAIISAFQGMNMPQQQQLAMIILSQAAQWATSPALSPSTISSGISGLTQYIQNAISPDKQAAIIAGISNSLMTPANMSAAIQAIKLLPADKKADLMAAFGGVDSTAVDKKIADAVANVTKMHLTSGGGRRRGTKSNGSKRGTRRR
jgi:hypothetical protein